MKKLKLLLPVLLSVFVPLSVYAQTDVTAVAYNEPAKDTVGMAGLSSLDLLSIDLLSLELPPIDVLVENARKGPVTKVFEAQLEREKRELKNVRRTWMQNVKGFASYQYGSLSNLSYIYSPDVGTYIGEHKNLYTVGASVTIPLDEILNKNNKVKQQKAKIDEMTYNVDRWFDELHLQIIEEYTKALEHRAMLKVKAEAVTVAQAQYKMTQIDFLNGKADAQTLSRQKNIESNAVREYEESRFNLLSAIMKLEVLTHTQIINR